MKKIIIIKKNENKKSVRPTCERFMSERKEGPGSGLQAQEQRGNIPGTLAPRTRHSGGAKTSLSSSWTTRYWDSGSTQRPAVRNGRSQRQPEERRGPGEALVPFRGWRKEALALHGPTPSAAFASQLPGQRLNATPPFLLASKLCWKCSAHQRPVPRGTVRNLQTHRARFDRGPEFARHPPRCLWQELKPRCVQVCCSCDSHRLSRGERDGSHVPSTPPASPSGASRPEPQPHQIQPGHIFNVVAAASAP